MNKKAIIGLICVFIMVLTMTITIASDASAGICCNPCGPMGIGGGWKGGGQPICGFVPPTHGCYSPCIFW